MTEATEGTSTLPIYEEVPDPLATKLAAVVVPSGATA